MKISGYSWAGVPTHDFDDTMRFFEEVHGLSLCVRDDNEFGKFELLNGQVFEVFGPKHPEHKNITMSAIAFDVDDIHQARAELEAKGVHFTTETFTGGDVAWAYFAGPDGLAYLIWQRNVNPSQP